LGADAKDVVPRSADQGALPSSGDRTERVPSMTGDQAKLRGFDTQLLLDIAVRLTRGFMMLGPIRAKTLLEEVGDTAALKLARLHLQQIVREGEQPEAGVAKPAKRRRHFRMRRHNRELVRQLLPIRVPDF